MTKIACQFLLHVAFACSALFCALADPAKVEVRIGVIMPLTGSTASFTTDARRMIELMTPLINSRSGAYSYRFIIEDGMCGTGSAPITAAKKLVEIDNVHFMLVGCSGEILQTAPFLNGKGILTLSLFGSHPDVKKIGGYVFRTYPDADTGIEALVRVIEARNFHKVAVITEEVSYTEGRRKLITKLLGDRIVLDETFRADDQDLRNIILKAKASNAEVLYLTLSADMLMVLAAVLSKVTGVRRSFS